MLKLEKLKTNKISKENLLIDSLLNVQKPFTIKAYLCIKVNFFCGNFLTHFALFSIFIYK